MQLRAKSRLEESIRWPPGVAKRLTGQELSHVSAANREEALTAIQVSDADTICRVDLEPTGAFTALFIPPFEAPPPTLKPFVPIFNIPIPVCSRPMQTGLFCQRCHNEDTTFPSLLRNRPREFYSICAAATFRPQKPLFGNLRFGDCREGSETETWQTLVRNGARRQRSQTQKFP